MLFGIPAQEPRDVFGGNKHGRCARPLGGRQRGRHGSRPLPDLLEGVSWHLHVQCVLCGRVHQERAGVPPASRAGLAGLAIPPFCRADVLLSLGFPPPAALGGDGPVTVWLLPPPHPFLVAASRFSTPVETEPPSSQLGSQAGSQQLVKVSAVAERGALPEGQKGAQPSVTPTPAPRSKRLPLAPPPPHQTSKEAKSINKSRTLLLQYTQSPGLTFKEL